MNLPTKIIFDCKSSDNKYIMTNKTKTFDLNEFIIFSNEIIYFFKINPKISIINISFEINEKRHNFHDFENIKLNDILNKNDNEEINLNVKDEIFLTLRIKIMEKFNKKEIFETIQEKLRESQVTWLKKNKVDKKVIKTGISIQERIKIFSGNDNNTNKMKNTNQNKPGKLKLPLMFQNSTEKSYKKNAQYKVKNINNTEEIKLKESKGNNKKEEIIKKDEKVKNSKENNNIDKNKNGIIIEEKPKINENINKIKEKEEPKEKKIENNNEIKTNKIIEEKNEEVYDFKINFKINENINIKNSDENNDNLDDLYEERECTSDEEGEINKDKEVNEDNKAEKEDKKILNKENININEKEEKNINKNENEINGLDNDNKKNENLNISEEQQINNKQDKEINKDNIEKKNSNINAQKVKKNISLKMASTISYHPKLKGSPSFKSPSGDIFLESQNYSSYLKSLQQKGLKESKRETFCEGFFIASFPYKNPSVIEKSHSFPAQCGHEECSKLPSMKPEIIMRYPLKDTKKLEMNNLAASICFPTGIKVCYSEANPSNVKDFVTPITNQKGERYYMITFHFYKKFTRDEYDKKFEMHPLKHHLMRFGDAYLSLSEDELTDEKIKEIQDSLEFCQELGFRDFLYVPHCLCIISKYPYVNELVICLKSIYRLLNKDKLETFYNLEEYKYEINNLLMYLIHSIPIPDPNSLVKFFVPYYGKKIEIYCPKIDDINIMNENTISLLRVFSIEHILMIFKLILSEKKILFIDKYYDRLAKITDSFITLLYPLQWIHTYIPIMSEQMIKYVETFLPYINGVHDSLLPLVTNIFKENDEENEEVFLVYINEDKIKLSSSLCGKKTSKTKYIQDNIPPFPSELEKKLKNKLKKMKNEFAIGHKKESLNDIKLAELEMRDAFIDFFIDMLHGYEKYLFLLDEQEVVFNKSLFLDTIPASDKRFYDEFIDSQLFQNFSQNIIKEDFDYYFNKLNLKEKERELKNNKNNKDKGKANSQDIKVKNNNLFNYVVAPYYLNIRENEVRNIEISLKRKYTLENNEPSNSGKITADLLEIDKNQFLTDNCLVYMTPGQIKAEQGNLKNNNLELRRSAIPKYTGAFMVLKAKMNIKLAMKNSITDSASNEKKKTQMKEYIRDIVVKIFKSEVDDIDSDMKSNFMNIIDMAFGREYFISLISHNEKLVLLKKDSFKLLGYFFYNTLIGTLKVDETDKVIEEIVILIKSSKFFGMEEKGKTITIFDDYKKKIRNTPKIVQYNFWKKKFDLDFKSIKIKEGNDENKIKQDIIYNIVSEMIELKVIKSAIKSMIEKIINETFGKDSEISKETFKVFIIQINKARYISKVKE